MPNWCSNELTVVGDATKLAALKTSIDAGKFFESVVPIGEWDYDSAIAAWGTKWEADVYDCQLSGEVLTVSFITAWCPATGVYDALYEQGFNVTCYYNEPGMCFAGIYENGSDEYVDYASVTDPDALYERLGDELCTIFEICEMYEETEETA